MKKILTALCLSVLFLAISGCAHLKSTSQLPENKKLISGTLKNGLRYYILPYYNDALSLQLYVNVGSLDENENEQGYAHLIEHMAFRGTESSTADALTQLYRKIGMSIGAHLNAFTYFNKTEYILNLPEAHSTIEEAKPFIQWLIEISKGKFVFDHNKFQIEKEVVIAEDMTRKNKEPSFEEQQFLHLIKNTPNKNRLPIGEMEHITQATQRSLGQFKSRYYKPENSLLFISGKSAQHAEKIIRAFDDNLPNRAPISFTNNHPVDINKENFFFESKIVTSTTQMYIPLSQRTVEDIVQRDEESYLTDIIEHNIYARLNQTNGQLKQPLANIHSGSDTFLNNDYLYISTSHSKTQYSEAIKLISTEINRLSEHGISRDEYLTAKENWNARWQQWSHGSPANLNKSLADTTAKGRTFTSLETKQSIAKNLLQSMSLDSFNRALKSSLEQHKQWVFSGQKLNSSLLEDDIERSSRIIPPPPVKQTSTALGTVAGPAGSIINEVKNKALNITYWQLSNGVKVIVKKIKNRQYTNYTNITFAAARGIDHTAIQQIPAINPLTLLTKKTSISGVSDAKIRRLLDKNQTNISTFLDRSLSGIRTQSPNKNLSFALTLLNKTMTSAKIKQNTFDASMDKIIEEHQMMSKRAETEISRKVNTARLGEQAAKRYNPPSTEQLKQLSVDDVQQLYQQLYGSIDGYVMSIVGDVNLQNLRPDIEKYVASLPIGYVAPASDPQSYHKPYPRSVSAQGEHKNKFFINHVILSPTNKNTVEALNDELELSIISSILEKRLFDRLRGKNGLVYGVYVDYQFDILSPSNLLGINTVTDYKNHKKVLSLISDELVQIRNGGVTQAELADAKIALSGKIKGCLDDNQNIADALAFNALAGIDLLNFFENYPSLLKEVNTADIKQAIAHYLNKSGENVATLILDAQHKRHTLSRQKFIRG